MHKEMVDERPQAADEPWSQFQPAAIALQPQPRGLARMVTWTLCVMGLLAAIYAYVSHMDVVVSSQGRVMTPGRSKVVQPLEAGVVKRIHVRDGQAVKAGDVLVELDPTSSQADTDQLAWELAEVRAESERLQALKTGHRLANLGSDIPREVLENQQAILENRRAELSTRLASLEAEVSKRQADREAISTNLKQQQATLELMKKRHLMREELAQTGHISEMALIDTQIELSHQEREVAVQAQRLAEANAGMEAALQQKALAHAEFRSRVTTELAETAKRRGMTEKELVKAQMRSQLQVLRAPIDGVVQQQAVYTEGGVVTQAQVLMMIVPENEALEVESKVLNRDIGHIKIGQRVINKVETFDFTKYGYIEGEVQWVGTDAVVDERLGPVYPIRIRLSQSETPNVVRGKRGQITAGMSVTSDIRIGERRLLDYFLAPMLRYKEESLKER